MFSSTRLVLVILSINLIGTKFTDLVQSKEMVRSLGNKSSQWRELAPFQYKLLHKVSSNADKMVQLSIDSPAFLHEDIELECRFQLNSQTLYSIKWYKNDKEFFQYIPHEKPKVRYFHSKGVPMEIPTYEVSNDTFVLWLTNVNLDSQGIYRCEISTDAPDFATYKDWKLLEVYVLPIKSPRISGHKANFGLKGRIDLNCTSPKSKPASTLQWFINEQPAPSDYLISYRQVNHSDGLQSKTVRLKFIVNEEHFQFGNMKLKCVAIYKKLSIHSDEAVVKRRSKLNGKWRQSRPDSINKNVPNRKEEYFDDDNRPLSSSDSNDSSSNLPSTTILATALMASIFWLS